MIKFQSLPRQKRQEIRDEVLRLYSEKDLSYGEIAEENGVQVRTVEYIVRNFAGDSMSLGCPHLGLRSYPLNLIRVIPA